MRKALVATYLFAMLCFGFIIGSAIAENGMVGLWIFLLILDIIIGIALQHNVDGQTTAPQPNDQRQSGTKRALSSEAQAELSRLFLASLEKEMRDHIDVKERFDELYSALGYGNVTIVNGMDDEEYGQFLKAVCRQMPYAPPAKWLTGLRRVGADLWDGIPVLLYKFENARWEICQNVLVCLVRTPNELRFFSVEIDANSFMLCEFRNGSHLNYGDMDNTIELPARVKEILRKENLTG